MLARIPSTGGLLPQTSLPQATIRYPPVVSQSQAGTVQSQLLAGQQPSMGNQMASGFSQVPPLPIVGSAASHQPIYQQQPPHVGGQRILLQPPSQSGLVQLPFGSKHYFVTKELFC